MVLAACLAGPACGTPTQSGEMGGARGAGAPTTDGTLRAGVDAADGIRSAGAPATEAADTIHFADASGKEHLVAEPARRIISLVPSATETMQVLGVADRLVGRTDYDTAAWAADLPSVGGGVLPSLEAVLALEPDLVIRFEGADDARTADRLDEFGIRHVGVRPDGLEGIFRQIEIVGSVSGVGQRARRLVAKLRRELDDVRSTKGSSPKPSVIYLFGNAPPWVAGPHTFVTELIEVAGGTNAFSDLAADYSPVAPEEIRARSPDVILVVRASEWDERWAPRARVVEVGGLFLRPGPGVVEAARFLKERLHADTPDTPGRPGPGVDEDARFLKERLHADIPDTLGG